ncbi:SDR family oxidoreductase [Christiangramia sabulilitoris]|uniref:SDR family oxidoreductase n=1 Tax=Christiangramia sabulilitoris TaxID=2583991 RepID=A0A550I3P2_9FLAO|nr:SDR family oxidoreductase [Christiangramia sabulilitoris]TRO65586.1 SDR family oxidoreductase [Christiangramia sabulilitoris]
MWKLEGKKALITGGTKGIGQATVLEFAELGAQVLFTSRSKEDIIAFEKELQQQGFAAKGMVADSASEQDRNKIKSWIDENWRNLDILVNNAGINIRKKATEYTEDEFRKVMEINLMAPFQFCRLLYPNLKESGTSAIVNVASSAALQDVGTGTPYAMSKAGLLQQSRSLAVEWAGDNIRVNSVSPWFTKTPLTEGYLHNEEKMNSILSRTPLNRVAEASEISAIIAFLTMEKSSFITGHNIIADGGMSITAL